MKDSPSTKHNNRLLRWSLLLSPYAEKLNIVHRPGIAHGNVDGLSRLIEKVQSSEDVQLLCLDSGSAVSPTCMLSTPDLDLEGKYAYDKSIRDVYGQASEGLYHRYSVDPVTKKLHVHLDSGTHYCPPAQDLDNIVRPAYKEYNHFGIAKTHSRLGMSIWHPNLLNSVKSVI